MPSRPVLVFDGDCGFCTWSAGVLESWTQGRIDVVPWQRSDLAALGLSADECATAVQFVDGPEHLAGASAISGALRHATQPWRTIGRLAGGSLVAPTAESAYRLIAANRHLLPGSTPACAVPNA